MPGFPSGRDVVPSDMLVKANSGSERWMSGIGDMFAEGNMVAGQRNSWLAGLDWRSDSPRPIMSVGTSESPICIDEPTPNVTLSIAWEE